MIESKNNEKIKYYRKLRDKKYILKEKKYIVEGYHLVEEAIKKGVALEIILLSGKEYKTNLNTIYVSEEVLKSISLLETPQSIMAVVKLEKNDILGNKIVILDNVSDPGNVGTIIRNSVAFDIDSIVFTNNSVSPYNDKVIRASQGMIFHINIIEDSIENIFNKLKEEKIKIYVTSLIGKDLKNIVKENKYAVVFGNEGSGVSNYSLENADENIKIEMNESCESLNVGVSSGIILYEFKVK
ncbi:MAG: RNA methyltransferase [Bacilli bacterium]|nr:RNA methyltransferase [Bacilli bacterium]